ncbi:Cytochrome c3 [Carboxydocella thermautotrophica]|nr:Cytochrome c3 [Carboxydocella thermautotrophica]
MNVNNITSRGGERMVVSALRRKLPGIVLCLMLLVAMVFLSGRAEAQSSSDCALCHQSTVQNFQLSPLTKGSNCAVCHMSGAHASWPTVLVDGVGYFTGTLALQSSASYLHNVHAGNNLQATTSACMRCHSNVSCDACHNNVTHISHSLTKYLPQNNYAADGKTYSLKTLSCWTSNCHGNLPNVVRKRSDGSDLCYNCHSTGLTGHGDIDAKHQTVLPDQLNGSTGPISLNCGQCHLDKLNQEHAGKVNDCANCHGDSVRTDVKTVVDAAKATTDPVADLAAKQCFNCHVNPPLKHQPAHTADNVTNTPALHSDCNTCHSQTDLAGTVKTLATSNQDYSCFVCHNGSRSPLHKAVFSGNNQEYDLPAMHSACATCHGNPAVNDKINSLAATNPASAYSCNECHSGSMQPKHSAALTFGGASLDTVGFHPSCTTCHGNAQVTAIIPQLKATAGSYLCTDCHNGSVASIPKHQAEPEAGAATLDTTQYHPDCATCHANPAAQAKVSGLKQAGSYQCWSCHDGVVAPTATHKATLDQTGVAYETPKMHPSCNTCHLSTDSNVKTQIKVLVGQTSYNCSACHTGSMAPRHQALLEAGGTLYNTASFHPDCTTCHGNQQVVNNISALKTKNPYYCLDCHNGTVAPQPYHQARFDSNGQALSTLTFHSQCATCHGNTNANNTISQLKGTSGYLCTECHNGTVAANPSHQARFDANSSPESTVTIHKDCATCHTNTTVAPIIAQLKGTSGYQCSECHGDISSKHITTISTYPIDCTWCHSTSLVDTHLKPTITLNGTYTCNTCHGTTSPVNSQVQLKLKQCTDCHNGTSVQAPHPSEQYVPRHVNKFPAFLPEYAPDCGSCHNKQFISLHNDVQPPVGPVSCDVCHTRTTYKPIVTSLNTDCSGCHQATMVDRHTTPHNVDTAKYPVAGDCLKCHGTAGNNLLAVHKAKSTSTVTCNTCHGSSRPEVQQAIANNNVSCDACHSGGTGHKHPVNSFEAQEEVSCKACHTTDQATGSTELAKLHLDRGLSCATCHNPTFEGSVIIKDGAINVPYCSSCHDGTKAPARHTSPAPGHTASGYGALTSLDGYSCTNCHSTLKVTELHKSKGCNTCHDNPQSPIFATAQQVITSNWSRNTGTKTGYACDSCHGTVHGSWTILHTSSYVANPPMNCADCHKNYLPEEHLKALQTSSGIAYEVQRSSDNVNFVKVGTTTGTTFSVGSLSPNTTYYFRVRAYDAAGNYSGFSSVVSATTKPAPVTGITKNPGAAEYASGNNGDSVSDTGIRSLSPTALTRITDNKDTFYSTSDVVVKEGSNSDQWLYVRLLEDAKNYTAIKLQVRASWKSTDSAGSIVIYPYKSDGKSINTTSAVTYKITNPAAKGTYADYVIDVTSAASTMQNFGWMKFRIKTGSDGTYKEAAISEVRFLLSSGTSTESSVTTPSTTVAPVTGSTDTQPPTVPGGLTATAVNSAQIDLSWNPSSDNSTSGTGSCAVCHQSTRTEVQTAITQGKVNCDACHTIHADVNTVHTSTFVDSPQWDCSKCHSNVLSVEHQNRGFTCATCHNSTRTDVRTAISSKNTKCTACHVVHTDLTTPHLTGIFPTVSTSDDCLKCHTGQAAEFATTQASYHAILGTSKASGWGGYIGGYTATSQLTCKSCHGPTTPGGTTAYANILPRTWTYTSGSNDKNMLCYMCHDYGTYGGGSSTYKTGFSSGGGSKNLHNLGDHKKGGYLQCTWCHSAVPHGVNRPHLMVLTTDPKPYSSGAVLYKFVDAAPGNYSKSNCGSNSSLCGDHKGY